MARTTNSTKPEEQEQTQQMRNPHWERIQTELAQPFPAKYIGVKPGATSETSALLLWFVDARTVMDRLDAVVGPENWSFSWEPVPCDGNRVAVHGKLAVMGIVKEDVGEAQNEDEPFKSGVSDAFKRCAVHFGLGRYLYSMPQVWWPYDKQKRRFSKPDELADFIEKVVGKLIKVEGDASQLDQRELQIEASSESSGNTSKKTSSEGEIPKALQGPSTEAQQEVVKNLQIEKFGLAPNSKERYDKFQENTIGRLCKRSELTKAEADKIIKALMALPKHQQDAA